MVSQQNREDKESTVPYYIRYVCNELNIWLSTGHVKQTKKFKKLKIFQYTVRARNDHPLKNELLK